MSLLEGSWFGGKPIAYFKFMRGAVSWCYTSSDKFETLNGDTYTPVLIKRSAISQGAERGKKTISVSLPSNLPVAGNWRPFSPSETIALTIMVRHVGEVDVIVEWMGHVIGPKFNGPNLNLVCQPTSQRSRAEGGGRMWMIGCDLVLYEKGVGLCNLEPEAIETAATLTAVDEPLLTVTAPEFTNAPKDLAGGKLQWVVEEIVGGVPTNVTYTRDIISQAGDTITLDSFSVHLAISLNVSAFTKPLTVEATVTNVTGLVITAAEFTEYHSGRLAGGYIKWMTVAGVVEYRSIKDHVNDTITIDYGALDLAPALVVTAYPGCAHNWAACGQLNNRPNYGGNLHMPIKSPYDGNPVW